MNGLQKRCNKYINGSDVAAKETKRKGRVDTTCIIVLIFLFHDFDGDDDANDGNDEEEYKEANPALLACRSCRGDSLIRVAKTTGPVRQLTTDSCRLVLTQFRRPSQLR
jgi:hypothetical protein